MYLPKIASLGLFLASSCLVSAESQSFGLYAYGDNVGGLPMYYADGNAVVAPNPPSNASTAVRVSFTKGDDGLVGNPNATTNSTGSKDFSDQMLFVPGPSSDDHQMGFTANGSTNMVTNKFVWYGNFLLVEDESGEYTSLFSVPSTAGDGGSYSLLWNATDDDDVVPVTLRSIAPSNA
ncbi:hypothetical protein ASPWEDRAFT_29051 [Aspergillus wentii DTO 134E9]|uniref:Uncharacterized protein n=1 Tax=Aspergillus wentii DTO 134E9 TaxID=1073089 RepID=A0A1L9RG65_ASPWE|nr:uncharacterized protein ASPWEDRAFT_29051 [Aspergillus wentii DTO 134E9]KAI9925616.1 hypothetical protein MW887_005998 [Aspergillus wentii]OJJ33857.1 hypothetical protein ASPWEDRAFT_29051 [Aspergillus wentii DTO 134E9]